ncbi:MAG: hypothetical protein AB7P52_05145 [Alphaproteobacteria bacterium]
MMNEQANGTARSPYPVDYEKIALAKGDPLADFWLSGYARGHPGYYFSAKVYDRASAYGLYGSRVSKLEIWHDGEMIIHYDRGWATRPPTPDDHEIVNKIVSAFPQPTRQQYRDHKRAQRDHERGRERSGNAAARTARRRRSTGNDIERER